MSRLNAFLSVDVSNGLLRPCPVLRTSRVDGEAETLLRAIVSRKEK